MLPASVRSTVDSLLALDSADNYDTPDDMAESIVDELPDDIAEQYADDIYDLIEELWHKDAL